MPSIPRLALTLAGLMPAAFALAADKPPKQTAPAPLLLVEDFEETAPGQIPKTFTKQGAVAVVDDVAHSGHHALRTDAAVNGARRITINDSKLMTALGGEHWGRLYFKVQLPVPVPKGEGKFPVIHSTIVAGSAQSPQFKDSIEVRVLDVVMGPNNGAFQWIYNVQPRKRPEFANGSKYDYHYTDEWTLAEWHVDFATQSYTLFINGSEIPGASMNKGPGNFEKAEIPEVFESLSFGWNNYQKAEPTGFVAWIDDIALCKERIGDRGLPLPPKALKPPKK
ncbi:MAG TPA: hypothetical protein VHX44_06065 [Planctomycetota bacterium]|nr:hypothetical protein [Planctomycetota bacterium]